LLKGLQEFSTLKQIMFFEIELECIISNYNQGHITWELSIWASIFVAFLDGHFICSIHLKMASYKPNVVYKFHI